MCRAHSDKDVTALSDQSITFVPRSKIKKIKSSVSIHLMNLYPLRWVHSLLQWNSVLITEQEGDGGRLRAHRYRDSRDGDRPVIHNKLLILRLERKTARDCLIM